MARTPTATPKTTNGKPEPEVVDDVRAFVIPRPETRHARLAIVGISPLIQHAWSAKAVKALEDSQTGKAKAPRAAKQPEREAMDAAYIVPGHEGDPDEPGKFYHPASAFKHAYLYGCAQLDDVKRFPKTRATGWMFVDADPILTFESVTFRPDITRNPTQMVYRPMFDGWGCELEISYNANSITLEQVAAIMDLGGVGGIGEWRPSAPTNKSGSYGRFRVDGVTEIRVTP